MVSELILNIEDLIQNSIRAGADLIRVDFHSDGILLNLSVTDNGCGMSDEELSCAIEPFCTTKKERKKKIGLGIPLFRQVCEMTGGSFRIKSYPGKGTEVTGNLSLSHPDVPPAGDIAGNFYADIVTNQGIDFEFRLIDEKSGYKYEFSTAVVKKELELTDWYPDEVREYMKEELKRGFSEIQLY